MHVNHRHRFTGLLTAAVLAAAVAAPSAQAHVALASTSPKAGSTGHAKKLRSVRLTFTGPIRSARVTVTGPQGKVSKGRGGRDPRNIKRALVALRGGLAVGGYRVAATTVSADGHTQKWAFSFRLK